MAEMSRFEKSLVNRLNPVLHRRTLQPFFTRHLELPSAPAMLELGCGTGQAALIAYERYQPTRFVVTDYDPSQVYRARRTFEAAYGHVPGAVSLEATDALALPYSEAAFDVVFAFFVLHHVGGHVGRRARTKLRQGLTEIDRVLKPDGKFVYAEIYQQRTIRDYLDQRGYDFTYRRRLFAFVDQVVVVKQRARTEPSRRGEG